jgi:hypothetical protein
MEKLAPCFVFVLLKLLTRSLGGVFLAVVRRTNLFLLLKSNGDTLEIFALLGDTSCFFRINLFLLLKRTLGLFEVCGLLRIFGFTWIDLGCWKAGLRRIFLGCLKFGLTNILLPLKLGLTKIFEDTTGADEETAGAGGATRAGFVHDREGPLGAFLMTGGTAFDVEVSCFSMRPV